MKNITRMFGYTKPWVAYIVISTVALLVSVGINLTSPYIIKQVIALMESHDFERHIDSIVALALLLLACYVVQIAARFFCHYYSHVASWNMVNRVRCMVYDHLQKLSMNYYHDKQTGQLMSWIISDTSTFENVVAHAVPEMIANTSTLVGVLIILLLINPLLTLLVCIPIPFIALLSVILRRIRRYFKEGQAKMGELNAILQDNFSGIREIQVFNKQECESERIREKSTEHAAALIKALFYSGILNPAVWFITSVGTIIVLIAGPIIALKSNLDISDVVAFLLYLNLFYAPISTLTQVVEDMQHALAGAERVFEILDTEPDIKDEANAKSVGRLSGQIEFQNVTFSYKDDIIVLDDISFEAKAGQMIALVGPTGVGKSTISGLMARFYDPVSGAIMMDGINIKTMTLESLRNQLSLVLQDVFLFNGTIYDNIAYGCCGATIERVKEAARIACIDEYIEQLPDKYDTVIGERGVRLSGGQKQRLSIARSVLRDSPVLILDEATSSVDTETERQIQKAIGKIAGSRTLVVIAHRLSTIKKADVIIALQDGKVAECGTHEELLARDGIYAGLCKIQM